MLDSSVNVLIVDDDEGDRKQLRRTLKETGLYCECVEAVSLERAMAACGKSAFDCVFVDYRMPGDDGLHSIDALRERYPFMPIVMVTGQGDEMVASEAIKLGASDYIAKKRIGANRSGAASKTRRRSRRCSEKWRSNKKSCSSSLRQSPTTLVLRWPRYSYSSARSRRALLRGPTR